MKVSKILKENKIGKLIKDMSWRNKLIYSIIIVIIFALLFYLIIQGSNSANDIEYDYLTSEYINIASSYVSLNEYAIVKEISDNFIAEINSNYSIEEIYRYCIFEEYKEIISGKQLNDKLTEIKSKLSTIVEENSNLLPDHISKYKDNFYIVNFKGVNSEITVWIGIALDNVNSKYYIWYLE